jgi:2,4-dienoyl-CoA reductase-like NADH-dependent reductase (Old Yellow Enzyme family)
MITEAEQAEHIVSTGEADAVFLARAMLRNPRWALAAAHALNVDVEWPQPLRAGKVVK